MKLSLFMNPIAQLRQWSGTETPDPVTIAAAAEMAGIDGIVCAYTAETGEVTDRDLRILKTLPTVYLHILIPPSNEEIRRVMELKPDQVTFVPERGMGPDAELRDDMDEEDLLGTVENLHAAGINAGVIAGPEVAQIKAARRLGVDFVVLNTHGYARAGSPRQALHRLEEVEASMIAAGKLGMRVQVFGGLDHRNLNPVVECDGAEEAILGHRFLGRSLLIGLERAVDEVKRALVQ
ncbi:hypothetical protein GF324_10920 [bacterium]|nr:hypothetical protein [bacterium]